MTFCFIIFYIIFNNNKNIEMNELTNNSNKNLIFEVEKIIRKIKGRF